MDKPRPQAVFFSFIAKNCGARSERLMRRCAAELTASRAALFTRQPRRAGEEAFTVPSIFHEKRLVCAQVGETVFNRFGQTAQSHKRGAAAFSSTAQSHKRGAAAFSSTAQSGTKRPPAPSTVLRVSKLSSESTVAERALFSCFSAENDRFKPRRPLQQRRGSPRLRQLRSPAEDVFFHYRDPKPPVNNYLPTQNCWNTASMTDSPASSPHAERSPSNFPYRANIPRPSAPAALSGGGCAFSLS